MNSVETKPVFELVLFRNGPPAGSLRQPERPGVVEEPGSCALEVDVLCTGIATTVKAIESAVELARGLHARLRLLVAQVVPYAVPLETPPVLVEFQEAL